MTFVIGGGSNTEDDKSELEKAGVLGNFGPGHRFYSDDYIHSVTKLRKNLIIL